ncbi:MAG TPA: MFS transporter, partial [Rhizomicrobium sp.]|nr:MFS transporter [Rhizomicrobium sp.]
MSAAKKFPDEDHATREAAAVATPESFASVTTREERRRAFLVLFISLTCMGAGQSVMYSILPSLARELGITEFQAQLPFAVSGAIWLFTSTYWGKRSDHWGRKPVILMGLTAFGVSFAAFAIFAQLGVSNVMAVAYAYPAMIAARSIYGIFGSGASPAAQAYVADRTTRAERTQGVATINAAFGLGTTFGPLFGSVLVAFGAFLPYYFTAAVAFASAASIWFLLPERTRPR